jgi:hypothetical protein
MPNFQARSQLLFHIMLRTILIKSVASFFIWYPNVSCYLFWVSDTDMKQTARRLIFLIWELIWSSRIKVAFYIVHVQCCQIVPPNIAIVRRNVHCLNATSKTLLQSYVWHFTTILTSNNISVEKHSTFSCSSQCHITQKTNRIYFYFAAVFKRTRQHFRLYVHDLCC